MESKESTNNSQFKLNLDFDREKFVCSSFCSEMKESNLSNVKLASTSEAKILYLDPRKEIYKKILER